MLTSALSSSLGTLSVVSLSVHGRETQAVIPACKLSQVSAPLFPEAKWAPDLPISVPFLRSNTDLGRCQSDHGPSDAIASREPGDVCSRSPCPGAGCWLQGARLLSAPPAHVNLLTKSQLGALLPHPIHSDPSSPSHSFGTGIWDLSAPLSTQVTVDPHPGLYLLVGLPPWEQEGGQGDDLGLALSRQNPAE